MMMLTISNNVVGCHCHMSLDRYINCFMVGIVLYIMHSCFHNYIGDAELVSTLYTNSKLTWKEEMTGLSHHLSQHVSQLVKSNVKN